MIFDLQQLANSGQEFEALPIAGVELIKQFTECRLQAYALPNHQYCAGWGATRRQDGTPFTASDRITQVQANELLHRHLKQDWLPVLASLPNWRHLNEHRQGAILSFAHSLGDDRFVLSPYMPLYRALQKCRWDQIPTILQRYHGPNPPANIVRRRQKEAELFCLEVSKDRYITINCSRLLELARPHLYGNDVRNLQAELVNRGYEIAIDGHFGPMTQWAVEKFQASVGLTVDGIAGVKTQRIIYARALHLSTPYLMGSDVQEVQHLMSRIGYEVSVSGIFDWHTWQAVLSFQRYFGLTEDGVVQGETLTRLLYLPALAEVS
ncbi:MAG: hypothetical protein HC800_21905 [Phormidesmis sp. RL_2_1]|nr:hypothetical protein [Phormidesmis sp. RL_2_1]